MATETTEEFGTEPPDPFDPDAPGGDQQEDAGPGPAEEERAAVRDPEPGNGGTSMTDPDSDKPHEDQPSPEEAKPGNAGKRIVLAGQGELGPYQPLYNTEGELPTVKVFEGDDKQARTAALEQYESLRTAAQESKLWLVTVPLGSWKPRQPKPPKPGWVV